MQRLLTAERGQDLVLGPERPGTRPDAACFGNLLLHTFSAPAQGTAGTLWQGAGHLRPQNWVHITRRPGAGKRSSWYNLRSWV